MGDLSYKIPQAEYQHRIQLMGSRQTDYPEALQAGMGIGRTITKFGRRVGRAYHDVASIPNQIDNAIPTTKQLGRQTASALMRQGVPGIVGGLTSLGVATATANPLMGVPAGVGATYATKRAMDKLATSEGYGFPKGSKQAKDFMASLRAKRKKNITYEKGSQEAKDYMAKLRALRKTKKKVMEGEGAHMSGEGKKVIDQKFSIRDIAHQVNQIPKTIKDLKGSGMRMHPRHQKSPAPYGDWASQGRGELDGMGQVRRPGTNQFYTPKTKTIG